jgi:hypothetical protein
MKLSIALSTLLVIGSYLWLMLYASGSTPVPLPPPFANAGDWHGFPLLLH